MVVAIVVVAACRKAVRTPVATGVVGVCGVAKSRLQEWEVNLQ